MCIKIVEDVIQVGLCLYKMPRIRNGIVMYDIRVDLYANYTFRCDFSLREIDVERKPAIKGSRTANTSGNILVE